MISRSELTSNLSFATLLVFGLLLGRRGWMHFIRFGTGWLVRQCDSNHAGQ